MKYLKSFNSVQEQKQYMSNHWFTPYVHMFTNKTLDYEQKYIPVEYISSTETGGQYIDLGCHLMENTDDIKINIKFNIRGTGKSSSGNSTQSTLIACQPEVNPYPGFVLRRFSDNAYYIHLQTKWQFTNSVKRSTENKYDSKCLSYQINNRNWYEAKWQNIYEFWQARSDRS